MNKYLDKIRIKSRGVEKKINTIGFLALMVFVAIPIPGTGAWTGTLISWVLGLNRLKSIIYISLGVLMAGLIILLASMGIFNIF